MNGRPHVPRGHAQPRRLCTRRHQHTGLLAPTPPRTGGADGHQRQADFRRAGYVLGLSPDATIDLNMRIRNSAVTEFVFSARRHTLLTYNTLAHVDSDAHAGWVTYA